jgi:hypothetical protein
MCCWQQLSMAMLQLQTCCASYTPTVSKPELQASIPTCEAPPTRPLLQASGVALQVTPSETAAKVAQRWVDGRFGAYVVEFDQATAVRKCCKLTPTTVYHVPVLLCVTTIPAASPGAVTVIWCKNDDGCHNSRT